jgi:hypothetical protein
MYFALTGLRAHFKNAGEIHHTKWGKLPEKVRFIQLTYSREDREPSHQMKFHFILIPSFPYSKENKPIFSSTYITDTKR